MRQAIHLKYAASQQGFSLVEVLIAILIFSVGILGVVGLQGSMITATTDARHRAAASFVAQQRIGLLWTTDAANRGLLIEAKPGTDISAQSGLPNGRRTTTSGDPSCFSNPNCYVIRVTWQMPGSTAEHSVVNVAYPN